MLLAAASVAAASEPVQPRLLTARDGALVRTVPDGSASRTLLAGADGAWSPDGTLIVFVRNGDLWLANSDGSGTRPLTRTPKVAESQPAWSRDGARIAYTALADGARQIRLLSLPHAATQRIASSNGEEWSPAFTNDGRRLAFVTTRDGPPMIYTARPDGTAAVAYEPSAGEPPLDLDDLAWSPDATRLSYTRTDSAGTSVVVDDRAAPVVTVGADHPVWSPDGTQLAYASNGALQVMNADGTNAHAVGTGAPLDWRRVPLGTPRFPDIFQRPPSGLVLTRSANGHSLLGFTSLVDNRGPGILHIRAVRPLGSPFMLARQLVQLAGGGNRIVQNVGLLQYTVAPPHYHWHLLGFERYELRRASDFKLLVRDRKSGFCIADHYGIAVGVPHGAPRFLGSCAQFRPAARTVEEGSSVGYTDRYPANFHGQNLDVTKVPPGLYWIVHRANSDFGLREPSYSNDTASLLIRITWPDGRRAVPRIKTLRTCYRERC
jgi:hypothetical protein